MSRSIVQKYGINRFNNEASNHKSSLLLLAKPKLPLPYRTYSRTYHIMDSLSYTSSVLLEVSGKDTKYVKQKTMQPSLCKGLRGALWAPLSPLHNGQFGFLRLSKPSS